MTATHQTVVETNAFLAAAKACMSEEERRQAVDMIAINPECGVLLQGGGGLRKVRFGVGGGGKSGGVRILYFFSGERIPLFLLTVFAKNEKANLSQAERQSLAKAAKRIAQTYGVKP